MRKLTFAALTPAGAEHIGEMERLWIAMRNDGLDGVTFYDGGVRTMQDFTEFMSAPANHVYAAYLDGEPAAIWWLNGFSGQTAMLHFCVLRHAWDDAVNIGRIVCAHMLKHYSALYGVTPKPFRHALRLARRIGFVRQCVIPGACRLDAANGRCVDGVLTLMTKKHGG